MTEYALSNENVFSPPSPKWAIIKAAIAFGAIALTMLFSVLLTLTIIKLMNTSDTMIHMMIWQTIPQLLMASVLPSAIAVSVISGMNWRHRLFLLVIPALAAICVQGMLLAALFLGELELSYIAEEFFAFFFPSFGYLISIMTLYWLLRYPYQRLRFFNTRCKQTITMPVQLIQYVLIGGLIFLPAMLFPDRWMSLAVIYCAAVGAGLILLFGFGFSAFIRVLIWSTATTLAVLLYKFTIYDYWYEGLLTHSIPLSEDQMSLPFFWLVQIYYAILFAFAGMMFMLTTSALLRYHLAKKKAMNEIQTMANTKNINAQPILNTLSESFGRLYPACWPPLFKDTLK